MLDLINKFFKTDCEGSIELKEMTRIMTSLLELEGYGRGGMGIV